MYNVDTEHVNGEGYGMWREDEKKETSGIALWVCFVMVILFSVFVGWMFAVAIGGF